MKTIKANVAQDTNTYYVFSLPFLGSREEKFLGTLKVPAKKSQDYKALLFEARRTFQAKDGLAIRDRYRYSSYQIPS